MQFKYPIVAVVLCAAAVSCNTSPHAKEARERARRAAQEVLATNEADTLTMQNSVLDAKAAQSEYALVGDSAAVKAFDEEFQKVIKEKNPQLAERMFVKKK